MCQCGLSGILKHTPPLLPGSSASSRFPPKRPNSNTNFFSRPESDLNLAPPAPTSHLTSIHLSDLITRQPQHTLIHTHTRFLLLYLRETPHQLWTNLFLSTLIFFIIILLLTSLTQARPAPHLISFRLWLLPLRHSTIYYAATSLPQPTIAAATTDVDTNPFVYVRPCLRDESFQKKACSVELQYSTPDPRTPAKLPVRPNRARVESG